MQTREDLEEEVEVFTRLASVSSSATADALTRAAERAQMLLDIDKDAARHVSTEALDIWTTEGAALNSYKKKHENTAYGSTDEYQEYVDSCTKYHEDFDAIANLLRG